MISIAMSLKRVSWVDSAGRKKMVLLPEGVPESEAEKGILVGPPPLDDLGLPIELEVRLNNELFARELFTVTDVMKRTNDVHSSIQSALKLDTQKVINVYMGEGYVNARSEVQAPEGKRPTPPRPARRRN